MRSNHFAWALALAALSITGCNSSGTENSSEAKEAPDSGEMVYEATLQPLNSAITNGSTTGKARFVIQGDEMTVTIDVQGAPANTEHWQHFHGFENGDAADVPTQAQDKNGDGIIDVVETGAVSGTTMVPFNADPAGMQVGSDTYPKADEHGSYHYEAKIPLKQLNESFKKALNDENLSLDKRVLYIHGVPADEKLPATVESIGDIPAQVTIPIAAGRIVMVK